MHHKFLLLLLLLSVYFYSVVQHNVLRYRCMAAKIDMEIFPLMYTAHTFMRCYRSNQADIREIQWKHIVTAASQLYLRRSVHSHFYESS